MSNAIKAYFKVVIAVSTVNEKGNEKLTKYPYLVHAGSLDTAREIANEFIDKKQLSGEVISIAQTNFVDCL